MGNPRGFLEFERREPGYRPREERLRDYKAVELRLSHREVLEQSARCMNCGTPFCHALGCPLSNVIPEFNDLVYRERWEDALDMLLSTNNFPEFTGRVCPAPCEAACVAGINGDPVTIRQIELSIIEKGFQSGYLEYRSIPAGSPRGRVAVVGAGPAGLAAADTLNRAGCHVTVYDEAPLPGGMLRYGIPDFKLEKWVIDRRLQLMVKQGVMFETGVHVGVDISYRFLRDRNDAVCLACGARKPRDLQVEGRELGGIHFAMDYLTQQNRRVNGEPLGDGEQIHAGGKTVVVIGGGDTGSDCLGTALRQGAEKVYQLEILPEPPPHRPATTPWPTWPHMLRSTHAHKEGGQRLWSVMTCAFRGENGRVRALRCMQVDWLASAPGQAPSPVPRPGSEFELEADLVLLAMGFVGPVQNRLIQGLGVACDEQGHVKADERRMTNVPGLFVAGDMTQGQSLVVKAMADGRRAARGILQYLQAVRDQER